MKTLFKPFIALEYPVRYFLLLFIIFFGGWHLADDLRSMWEDANHTTVETIFVLTFLSAVLAFGSRYIDQRKAKRQSDENSANSPVIR
jgi:NADH:ubiquinone oxidoreductase subunit H